MRALNNKVAIVTGSSRGIGAAIAERLAYDGFRVVINYAKSVELAQAMVRKIERAGGKAVSIKADIRDAAAVNRLFDSTVEAFGAVDVLVNNAGVMRLATIANHTDEQLQQQLDINLKGPLYTMSQAAKRLRDGGRIINLSSSVVGLLQPGYGVYAATKAAIETLTVVLSKEMRGRNITVNAVAPGPTVTELFTNGKSSELIARIAQQAPLERLGRPEDIAAVVSFLAGLDGGWVNGQILRANGGII